MIILDCTLRDGGYYNGWDFPEDVVNKYLQAMSEAGVDIVELGLRSLVNKGFKGACAYTSDDFIKDLQMPISLKVGVMLNASELVGDVPIEEVLQVLFPNDAVQSPVDLVRIACHVHEFADALPAASWLKQRGFLVGFNLMQIADRSETEIKTLAKLASAYDIDALYFADSMGSMTPDQTAEIIGWLRTGWQGAMGIHTHDNLGLALSNTLRALDEGVTWVDATVTGMGRGPGNARTEELVIEMAERRNQHINMIPLMQLLESYFKPMQHQFGWGTNPYYYLSGKYGIHPSYVQQMLADSRFSEEDILAVLNHLRAEGGKKFSLNTLDAARHFYQGEARGSWSPKTVFEGRELLILGTGPGVAAHRSVIERFIKKYNPVVLALNTQSAISSNLIDYRVACHPVRLLADCRVHATLPQPLITPYSMLPEDVRVALGKKETLDYGLAVREGAFEFGEQACVAPTSLVMAYTFALCAAGNATRIFLAGFDGYEAGDPRNQEMNQVVLQYAQSSAVCDLVAITPTKYEVSEISAYGAV